MALKRSQILKDLQLFCEYLCDGRSAIEITMDDLTNPRPERVQPLYLFFMGHFFLDCDQRLMQGSFMTSENIEYPEICSDNRITLLLVLGHFFNSIGVDDFSASDIFEPTPKRTQKLFSNLVNYMKLVARVDEDEDMQRIVQEQEDLICDCEQLAEQRAKSEEEIGRLQRKRHQDEQHETNLHFQREQELEQLEENSANKDQILAELSKYNKACNKAEEHLSSLQQRLEMKDSQSKDLESRLIQSPEKLAEQVTELDKRETEAKEKSIEASKIYTEWQTLSTQAKAVPLTFESVDATAENSLQRIENLSSMSQNIERLQASIGDKKRLLRDTMASAQNLERKCKSLDQRIQQSDYNQKLQQNRGQSKSNLARDLQLLTMEEAEMYEKKEKQQKSFRILQEKVENKKQELCKCGNELDETTEKISLAYKKRDKAIVGNYENVMKICGK